MQSDEILSVEIDIHCAGQSLHAEHFTSTDATIAPQIAANRPCDVTMLAAANVNGDPVASHLDVLRILLAAGGAVDL